LADPPFPSATTDPAIPPERPPLLSVQYLRALAALAVTLYHAMQWEDGGFDIGRAGVDVFFVISGVIMWRITAGATPRPGDFLLRRATRVAPLYWLATLGVGAVAVIWPAFLPEVHPQWRHLVLSLAFIPHLDPRGLPFPLLPPGWTLGYEAGFYLLFAAALWLPKRWRAPAVTAGLGAVVVAGFMLADPVYILGANPMLFEFVAGLWLGVALERGVLPGRAWGLGWQFVAVFLFLALFVGGLDDELWRPLIWGAPAALLVGGALCVEAQGRIFRSRSLLALGDASYALYLLHLPATAIVAHTLGPRHPWLFLPCAVAASTAAGLAAHRWVEKPLIRRARGLFPSRPSIGAM
jgi:exopolysaccharide production protein ExoZ